MSNKPIVPARTRYLLQPLEITLVHIEIALMLVGLFIGSALVSEAMIDSYKVHAQITQLSSYDEAVASFYTRFGGLPGDLVSIRAGAFGLPTGNGKEGHSDGDDNISSCDVALQWRLGCETALFWAQLSASGFVHENFADDVRLSSSFYHAGPFENYIPQSPIAMGVYVVVWNANATQSHPRPHIPYGNYYEITKIDGLDQDGVTEDAHALTPEQAYAIDKTIDDGQPFTGRVLVNGEAEWPRITWANYAKPGIANCVTEDKLYNTSNFMRTHTPLCHLAIRLQ